MTTDVAWYKRPYALPLLRLVSLYRANFPRATLSGSALSYTFFRSRSSVASFILLLFYSYHPFFDFHRRTWERPLRPILQIASDRLGTRTRRRIIFRQTCSTHFWPLFRDDIALRVSQQRSRTGRTLSLAKDLRNLLKLLFSFLSFLFYCLSRCSSSRRRRCIRDEVCSAATTRPESRTSNSLPSQRVNQAFIGLSFPRLLCSFSTMSPQLIGLERDRHPEKKFIGIKENLFGAKELFYLLD